MFLRTGPRSLTLRSSRPLTCQYACSERQIAPGLARPWPCGDIDAVAHQIAVAFLDHVAEMDANPKLDAVVGRQTRVALDEAMLYFDGAAHRVDHAAELDEAAVARALDDSAVMHRDGWVDQIASKRPKASENPILIRSGKSRVADDVGRPRIAEPVSGSRSRR